MGPVLMFIRFRHANTISGLKFVSHCCVIIVDSSISSSQIRMLMTPMSGMCCLTAKAIRLSRTARAQSAADIPSSSISSSSRMHLFVVIA